MPSAKREENNIIKIVWLDPFDIRCCSSDTLEQLKGFDINWAKLLTKVSEDFTKGMAFSPYKCKLCGRYWFKCSEGFWTVKKLFFGGVR